MPVTYQAPSNEWVVTYLTLSHFWGEKVEACNGLPLTLEVAIYIVGNTYRYEAVVFGGDDHSSFVYDSVPCDDYETGNEEWFHDINNALRKDGVFKPASTRT